MTRAGKARGEWTCEQDKTLSFLGPQSQSLPISRPCHSPFHPVFFSSLLFSLPEIILSAHWFMG